MTTPTDPHIEAEARKLLKEACAEIGCSFFVERATGELEPIGQAALLAITRALSQERQAVVAYVRIWSKTNAFQLLADAIEAGDHLATGEGR